MCLQKPVSSSEKYIHYSYHFIVESATRLNDLLYSSAHTVMVIVVLYLFDCVIINLIKFSGSPYADRVFASSNWVKYDLSEYFN